MNNNNNNKTDQKKWPKINVWKKKELITWNDDDTDQHRQSYWMQKKPTTMFKYKQTMNERTNEGQWQFGNERNV